MAKWKIVTTWSVSKTLIIEADTRQDAITIAEDDSAEDGEYVDDSWEILDVEEEPEAQAALPDDPRGVR